MMHTTRTPKGHWLAIAGSLVCLSGCAQLTSPSPLGGPQPGVFPPVTQAAAPVAATAATTPPSWANQPANSVTNATNSTNPTKPTNSTNSTNANNSVAQTAGTAPYVTRQFPNQPPQPNYNFAPPAGPPLPPGSDFVPSPALPPGTIDPYAPLAPQTTFQQGPRVREADLIINGFPARTGRIMLGGAVNSDAGVTGQLTIDERNFDITRWPTSFQDLFSGTAFRGRGQTFRIEAAPGTSFKRYTAQFADPNLFGYKPVSMSVSGFLYDRRFNDWNEERLGGRLAFGYRITPDLSISAGFTGQNVDIDRPRTNASPQLNAVVGNNHELFSGEISLQHDNRDSPIQASRGHYFELSFNEVFGDFDYSKFDVEYRRYWLISERADTSGRQTLSYSTRVGFTGENTPIFENYFAGGYATLRGFDFRGASPVENGVEVGGQFQWLNTVEYMFPLTADDAFRGVAFVDFGTVEQDVEIKSENYRVAPGLGLRVAIPMLGPAPLAFDFAYPVTMADTDERRIFSFYMSVIR